MSSPAALGLMITLARLQEAVLHDIDAVQSALMNYAGADVTYAAAIESAAAG